MREIKAEVLKSENSVRVSNSVTHCTILSQERALTLETRKNDESRGVGEVPRADIKRLTPIFPRG